METTVQVKFFGPPREALGKREIEMVIPSGTTVTELTELLIEDYPRLCPYLKHIRMAVNREYTKVEIILRNNDQVTCLPHVSGG